MSSEYFSVENFVSSNNRDLYDKKNSEENSRNIHRNHEQQKHANVVREIDNEWKADRQAVKRLDQGIDLRRGNFKTYSDSIESEHVVYSKEYNKTIILSVCNALVLGGCFYMWFA